MTTVLKGTSVVLAVALLPACAMRASRTAEAGLPPANPEVASPADTNAGSLSEFVRKIRYLSANAKPDSTRPEVATLEASDAELAAASALVKTAPTAERHRELAELYRRRGVLDAAYRHFNSAIALSPRDAAAYEGLARVWRDWGLPELGLGDAHRATFYAPHSASAQNTFGTIMQALGRYSDARSAYELASWLDPDAGYALNNLCYLSFLKGRVDEAIQSCTAALSKEPSLAAAHNNIGLAYTAAGRMDLANRHFLAAGDRASGLYNTGIAYLAAGNDRLALSAFDAASKARPTLNIARERAALIRFRLFRAATDLASVDGTPGR
jgi:tetratricopeptide (TPR) repeat protein